MSSQHKKETVLETVTPVITGYKHSGKPHVVGEYNHLEINAGEFVCLIGPNGVGKSTLIRSLTGMQDLLKGQVLLNGKNLEAYSGKELARNVSVVLTDKVNVGHLKAIDIVQMGRYPYLGWMGTVGDEDMVFIDKVVKAIGIEPLLDKNFEELSDGEKQRVMLGRALVQDTPFVVLDEPTAHLDMLNRIEMMRVLRKVAQEQNKAILLSTHELELALQAADTIWFLTPDKRLFKGSVDEVVVSGYLEKYFTKEGISFVPETGGFNFTSVYQKMKLCLTDEVFPKEEDTALNNHIKHIRMVWVKRILEREGYIISDENYIYKLTYRYSKSLGFHWQISDREEKKISSKIEIRGLLNVLREL